MGSLCGGKLAQFCDVFVARLPLLRYLLKALSRLSRVAVTSPKSSLYYIIELYQFSATERSHLHMLKE
jgi:hypothetical protein